MRSTISAVLVAVFAAVFTSVCSGQKPQGRLTGRRVYGEAGRPIYTQVSWGMKKSGGSFIRIIRRGAKQKGLRSALSLDIDRPYDWDICAGHSELLLAGDNKLISLAVNLSTQGFVVNWTHEVREEGSALIGVAYARKSERLYILDSRGYVRWAPYRSGGTMPSHWTTIITPSTIPQSVLPNLKNYALRRLTDEPARAVLRVEEYRPMAQLDSVDIGHVGGGGGAVVNVSLVRGNAKACASILGYSVSPGQDAVHVEGLAGAVVRIVSLESHGRVTVVGQETLNGAPETLVQGTVRTLPLAWGVSYAAMSSVSNKVWAPVHAPQLRFASNDQLPNGCKIVPFWSLGLFSRPGGWIKPHLKVKVSPEQAAIGPVTYPATLAVAVDDPNNRPIDFAGPSPILIPEATLDREVELHPRERMVAALARLNPPKDQAMVGAVLLFQWAIHDGKAYRVSDIVGVMIREDYWYPEIPFAPKVVRPRSEKSFVKAVTPKYGKRVVERIRKWLAEDKLLKEFALLGPRARAEYVQRLKRAE